jgi:hypothetical protein
VDDLESIDIDTTEDFAMAEAIANGKRWKETTLEEYDYGVWKIIGPKGLDYEAFISWIGLNRLKDISSPIVVVEPSRYGAAALDTSVVSGRFMYTNNASLFHCQSQKVMSTGNSQYRRVEYFHNQHYRLLRMSNCENQYYHQMIGNFDHHGINFGTVGGDNHGQYPTAIDILSQDRIIYTDMLEKLPFYIEPLQWDEN